MKSMVKLCEKNKAMDEGILEIEQILFVHRFPDRVSTFHIHYNIKMANMVLTAR